ncbi:MAG: 23S rRNA (adenine(2030)-N(6))-methyltransferase RlmJ [Neisseriaceae bacterium]|nr:23S rRNA (adenine(2030)-N(6))-methyltransferase RlmJ [Neisseriaceae bacterium]MBP6863400.1 23S rRNA (adenine(2030)-N(6))-methyltransferase RlmJ [Neisseriaceae bacterium]
MLSYRHAFHAGNHADVLKHLCLKLVLDYFNQKDKPYWYIDTHAGAGLYDLESAYAQKTGEHIEGISLLQQAPHLPPELSAFMALIASFQTEHPCYPGSPLVANALLRGDDKLRLFELHPTDSQHLLANFRGAGRRTQVKIEDGFKGLISQLPPPTRRAAVLIDPPYEQKQDYQLVVDTLKEALKRFASGCYMVWYPCLSRAESKKLPEALKKLSPEQYLQVELHVSSPNMDGFGMFGSGMLIINPPYQLKQQLQLIMPKLTELLAQNSGAKYVLQAQIN